MSYFLVPIIIIIIICVIGKKKSNKKSFPVEKQKNHSYINEQPKIEINIHTPEQPDSSDFSHTKEAFQDEFGLYPNEILLLSYAPSYTVDTDSFQNFWAYQYEIYDVKKKLNELVNKGFLEINCDLENNLKAQKVSFLKDLLADNNLQASGKKADLIKQIIDNKDSINLPSVVLTQRYKLTEKGSESLKKSAYVEYIHKNSIDGLNLWELNKLVHDKPGMRYSDIIWGYLNKSCMDLISEGHFGLYRNCKLSMFNMLYREEKYSQAYRFIMEIIYLDINDYLGNNFNPEYLDFILKSYFSRENDSYPKVLPTIIGYMDDIQEILNISDKQLEEDFRKEWGNYSMPVLLTVDECIKIYFASKSENVATLKEIFSEAKERIGYK